MSNIRVRFAPSPTGYLHVGGLRTALYNYLIARQKNGSFILRIEDTDQARYVKGAEENLIRALTWAGLSYDEGPDVGGSKEPYRQSERTAIYQKYAQQLVDEGKAYVAFDTAEELEEMRKSQEKSGMPSKYDRRALKLSAEEVNTNLKAGVPAVIRLKVPPSATIAFDDIVRGRVEFSSDMLDDQVLLKSDGFPTYHLANVVDDHLMEISHVIRGEEWLSSTPKHVLVYECFGWEKPVFAHLPLLLNPDKSKLSKRQGDVAVEEYHAKGYLPEALVNFVALLGWNPGDEREIFSLEELVNEFSLERVGKSGAVFNVEKLDWMNAEHLRRKPDEELLALLKTELEGAGLAGQFDDAYLTEVIRVMRPRVSFMKDFIGKGEFFFYTPPEFDSDVKKKRWNSESPELLKTFVTTISSVQDPTRDDYEKVLHDVVTASGRKNSELVHPLRLAVTGVGAGPGLYEILDILGKDESIRRITKAIETLQ